MNDLIYKILLCVPVVLKFVTILWMVLYIYSAIGVEIFGSNVTKHKESLWDFEDCSKRRYSMGEVAV